ncbi:hypothetical protein [Agitococcus lubricus]|uniref:hypothetical protein n=1 Tax=Agitococcus lubricus TaxID=1077255 RepID=UPI0014743159|nr:hypothetical protein [Agitococcus lubricus]
MMNNVRYGTGLLNRINRDIRAIKVDIRRLALGVSAQNVYHTKVCTITSASASK